MQSRLRVKQRSEQQKQSYLTFNITEALTGQSIDSPDHSMVNGYLPFPQAMNLRTHGCNQIAIATESLIRITDRHEDKIKMMALQSSRCVLFLQDENSCEEVVRSPPYGLTSPTPHCFNEMDA
jgi:hypothetical protein